MGGLSLGRLTTVLEENISLLLSALSFSAGIAVCQLVISQSQLYSTNQLLRPPFNPMALCSGCKAFRDRLFRANTALDLDDPLFDFAICFGSEKFDIHKNYAELAVCAERHCGFCRYLQRELWFYAEGDGSYLFRSNLEDSNSSIGISLYRRLRGGETPSIELEWQLRHASENRTNQRRLVLGPRSETEIRGAHPTTKQLLGLSRDWLTACLANHKHCQPVTGDETMDLPTRLLYVGLPEQPSIHLVHVSDLEKTHDFGYATLSYRWGSLKDAACTTSENLTERLSRITVDSIPPTIRDAVVVTRALGVRYLWVDALCIIQVAEGINEDWQREFPKMGGIYRNSLLTITASGAEDSSVGLFSRIGPASWPVRDYHFAHGTSEDGYTLFATWPDWNIAVERSSLSKRGWVLQERMSASRSLFFTEEGVFWECNELKTSEYGIIDYSERREFHSTQSLTEAVRSSSIGQSSEYDRLAWIALLTPYTEKTLTVPEDRLPAISGIAAYVAKLTCTRFAMGVFEHNLLRELAWYVRDTDNNATRSGVRFPGIPSWSWSSVDQVASFTHRTSRHLRRWSDELALQLSLDGKQIAVRARFGRFRVTMSTPSSGTSHTDQSRVVSSPSFRFEPADPRSDASRLLIPDKLKARITYDVLLDALPEEGGIIECIRWMECNWTGDRSATRQADTMCGALVVAPVAGEQRVYRRIGWLDVETDMFFERDPTSINLV